MTAATLPSSSRLPRRMLLIVGGAGALMAILLGWYFWGLRSEFVVLYDNLRPQQAAAIVAALEDDGVRYRLANSGRAILVPAPQADAIRVRMSANAAPLGGGEGFELFNESDMGLTEFAQKIRYQRAIQGELARTIMMMDGVEEARVHISMPERALFRSDRRAAEAAVTLVMEGPELETQARIEGVQKLVAAAVPDLSPTDVVVLNGHGEVISSSAQLVSLPAGALDHAANEGPALEFIVDLMHRALPNRRFEVTIEEAPQALAGGDDEASGAQNQDLSQEPRRSFVITTEASLTPEEHDRVRQTLFDADVIAELGSQAVVFDVAPMRPDDRFAPPSAAPPQTARPAPETAAPAPMNMLVIAAIAMAAFIGMGLYLFWRLRWREALTFEEHRALAESLSGALGEAEHG